MKVRVHASVVSLCGSARARVCVCGSILQRGYNMI